MNSSAERYVGMAVIELLEQGRVISMFSVIDILERRLEDDDLSRDDVEAILQATERLRRYI
ncbi:hypothetical protein [Enterobacter mori]